MNDSVCNTLPIPRLVDEIPPLCSTEWVLVTGGAGYIGSHIVLALLLEGRRVIVVDNFSTSSHWCIPRVAQLVFGFSDLSHPDVQSRLVLEIVDLTVLSELDTVFRSYAAQMSAVIHVAGFKSVRESQLDPAKSQYFHNNVVGAINLITCMKRYRVLKFVFSSSACVYGDPKVVPISESAHVLPTNTYGQTKIMVETIMQAEVNANNLPWSFITLRYFNPIGAHPSGYLGEDHRGSDLNLLPVLTQILTNSQTFQVFGNDYDTHDGTAVRDYLHVWDCAKGHVCALQKLDSTIAELNISGFYVYNLGTGKGHSVLDVLSAFQKVVGRDIPVTFAPRRAGDVAQLVSDPSRANAELDWEASHSIEEMCSDFWRWSLLNPHGYTIDRKDL